ncbi:MAG: metallophosphoesterase family protein [Candidatus Babeliales bacterium]|nr:metallophosphoesterase family protein [Candidatus Babeliales bacterium]
MNYRKLLSAVMLMLLCGLYSPVVAMDVPQETPTSPFDIYDLGEEDKYDTDEESDVVNLPTHAINRYQEADWELSSMPVQAINPDLGADAELNNVDPTPVLPVFTAFRPIVRGDSAQDLLSIPASKTPLTPYNERSATPSILSASPSMLRQDTGVMSSSALTSLNQGGMRRSASSNVYGASLSQLKDSSSSSSSANVILGMPASNTPLTPYTERSATPIMLSPSPNMSRQDTGMLEPVLPLDLGDMERSDSSSTCVASLSQLNDSSSSSSSANVVFGIPASNTPLTPYERSEALVLPESPMMGVKIISAASLKTKLDSIRKLPINSSVKEDTDSSASCSIPSQDDIVDSLNRRMAEASLLRDRAKLVSKISHNDLINYDYESWSEACNKLPSYTQIGSSWESTALNWTEFNEVLQRFFAVNQTWYRQRADLWIQDPPAVEDIFFNKEYTFPPQFDPFIQKLVINSGVQVAIRGDLHGDVHSLLAYIEFLQKEGHLDGFNIKDKNKFHMIFLGDYVDRGNYGVEVLYTLMRLKIANPDNVTMVRGNHEDTHMCDNGGFGTEFTTKFGNDFDKYHSTIKMYDFLPVALYLGSGSGESKDFMQCCHGGMEVGYNPLELLDSPSPIAFSWIADLNRRSELVALDLTANGLITQEQKEAFAQSKRLEDIQVDSYCDIGFMWSDFRVDETIQTLITDSKRGAGIYEYDKALTKAILKQASRSKHKVRGVLRAHQHSNYMGSMMKSILDPHNETCHKGVSKLWKDPQYKVNKHAEPDVWDGMVCTFLVAPDSVYSCKDPGKKSSSICSCDVPYSLNGCRGRVPTEKNPCKSALFDFDAFAIMTTADTYDQWKLKVHRNMLQDIVPLKNYDESSGSM